MMCNGMFSVIHTLNVNSLSYQNKIWKFPGNKHTTIFKNFENRHRGLVSESIF